MLSGLHSISRFQSYPLKMLKVLVILMLCGWAIAAPAHMELVGPEPLYKTHFTVNVPLLKSMLIAEPTHVRIHEPTLAKVGDIVEHVPTAISHQSSTIVHSRAQRLTPIVSPSVRSYNAPAIRSTVHFLPATEAHFINFPMKSQQLRRNFIVPYATPVVYARSA